MERNCLPRIKTLFSICLTALICFSSSAQHQPTVPKAKIKVTTDNLNFLLDLEDGRAHGGGEVSMVITNEGDAIEEWEIECVWKAIADNDIWIPADKEILDEDEGRIKLKMKSDSKPLGAGESLEIKGWVSEWEDYRSFIPHSVKLLDKKNNVEVELEEDHSDKGLYLRAPSKNPIKEKKIVGYYPNFDLENARKSLDKYIKAMDQIRFEWYSISEDGKLSPAEGGIDPDDLGNLPLDYWINLKGQEGIIDWCKKNGVEIIPVINNYSQVKDDFDAARMTKMLNDKTLYDNHLKELSKLLDDHPEFDGIDIDYENMMGADKDKYADFMEDLAVIVHGKGKILTTAVYAKVGEGTWSGPQAQDLKRIGAAVDEMLMMTYDLHWATSKSGILSSPDWVNDCLSYARSVVDNPGKIQQGIPFYGYSWKNGSGSEQNPGTGVTYDDAQAIIKEHAPKVNKDPNGGDSYFTYSEGGNSYTVYFQEKEGIEKKLEALDEYNLGGDFGGVAVWRIGSEPTELWQALLDKLKNGIVLSNELAQNNAQLDFFVGNPVPTPSTSSVEIKVQTNYTTQALTYSVTDVLGRVIESPRKIYLGKSETHFIRLNTENWNRGTYVFKIVSEHGFAVKNIVKN